jgi:hypothetical protein
MKFDYVNEWIEAIYRVISKRRSHMQMGIYVHFPIECVTGFEQLVAGIYPEEFPSFVDRPKACFGI